MCPISALEALLTQNLSATAFVTSPPGVTQPTNPDGLASAASASNASARPNSRRKFDRRRDVDGFGRKLRETADYGAEANADAMA